MSDDLSDEERAVAARARELYTRITSALGDATQGEALQALTMATVQLCLNNKNPDRVFLETLDGALAVFRDLTNSKYRNEDPKVS